MSLVATPEIAELVDDLRHQLEVLTRRIAELEKRPAAAQPVPTAPSPAPVPELSEDELIAISAAVAAYLGVRAHIRQIRLIGSRAWAQEGRVSIQASHRLFS
ncbi:MAG TPA: OadG family protein [Bryobacteraceae bacterium]|nr:OadG family protein [Bryobacteraceae bacterium]